MSGATAEGASIRPAGPQDVPALAAIYGHHVREGFGSFEEEPPDEAEMARRLAAVAAAGMPWLVAEAAGRVLGYAYAAPYRARSAYRFTVEDSIYMAPDAMGRGVGRRLLAALLEQLERQGLAEVIAVIGDSGNLGSIRLHAALGFVPVGTLRNVGLKRGRWLDTVFMQKTLRRGA
ncbi:GNAT family N-acetyltransferase [Zavarzinia sp. CC-PAN008]|uniref:GNAT family N-acetyltransferase n=1 Tax=Zavarzinia sp. CC-PAN008 TaxID=3243332 RepID=UPI003F74282F